MSGCDPSGTNPINLTATFPGTDSMPAWSPDGQRLAFYSDRDGGGIYTMNALGGDVRRVIPIKPGVRSAWPGRATTRSSTRISTIKEEGCSASPHRVLRRRV